jgi:TPR repeat protein
MSHRALAPSVLIIFFVASLLSAQQPVETITTNPRLATILRLPSLEADDWQVLFSEADSGDAQAQYLLGRIYDEGMVLSPDPEKSAFWLQKAVEQSYAPAVYYDCMKHVGQGSIERCLWRAAEDGVPDAEFWVGVAFEEHLWFGVTDKQEALKWFRRAAEHDNVDAENSLGQRYELGDGVAQDHALAAYWFRKAAEHVPNLGGAGQGRSNLGLLYMHGTGVPQDYIQAYKWFSLAGADKNVALVQRKMTPPQIVQAQQLADDWKKEHPDPAIY